MEKRKKKEKKKGTKERRKEMTSVEWFLRVEVTSNFSEEAGQDVFDRNWGSSE